eukprot:RCo011704
MLASMSKLQARSLLEGGAQSPQFGESIESRSASVSSATSSFLSAAVAPGSSTSVVRGRCPSNLSMLEGRRLSSSISSGGGGSTPCGSPTSAEALPRSYAFRCTPPPTEQEEELPRPSLRHRRALMQRGVSVQKAELRPGARE